MKHIFWKVYSTDQDSDSFCEKSEYFFTDKENALKLAQTLIWKTIPPIPEEEPFLSILPNPRRLLMKTKLINTVVDESEDSISFEAIYDAGFYELVANGVEGIPAGERDISLPQDTLRCLGSLYIKNQYLDEVVMSFSPRRGYEKWYAVRRIDICREVFDTED